jgi:hypothetical protein
MLISTFEFYGLAEVSAMEQGRSPAASFAVLEYFGSHRIGATAAIAASATKPTLLLFQDGFRRNRFPNPQEGRHGKKG